MIFKKFSKNSTVLPVLWKHLREYTDYQIFIRAVTFQSQRFSKMPDETIFGEIAISSAIRTQEDCILNFKFPELN